MEVWPLPRLSFRGLNSIDEKRPAALITQPAVWSTVSKLVNLPLVIQAEPNHDDNEFVDYLAANLPAPVQVIYAVGDGLLVNVAKAVASANNKPLVILPTAISSDAPLTWIATLNSTGGKPTERTTGPATEVVLDMGVIASAPAEARAAGIVDVLSIITGLLDWSNAAQKGRTAPETKLAPWAVSVAAGLAAQALKSAGAMGKADPEALRLLVDLLATTVHLDSQLGHRRASQGIEHLFANSVKADSSVSHAEKVGPGILLASALHNKDVAGMRTALEAAGVRLNRLKPDDIRAAVMALPNYARDSNAPYTILNDISSTDLEQALTRSTLLNQS